MPGVRRRAQVRQDTTTWPRCFKCGRKVPPGVLVHRGCDDTLKVEVRRVNYRRELVQALGALAQMLNDVETEVFADPMETVQHPALRAKEIRAARCRKTHARLLALLNGNCKNTMNTSRGKR